MSAQTYLNNSLLSEPNQDTEIQNQAFEALLDYLKHSNLYDLTGYKRSSLMRRFQHRMRSINIDSYQQYLEYLQTHGNEYLSLLDDVLINLTGFFRDLNAWGYLAAEVVPKIIASKQPDEPIRIWSAGCASGQESYSLLIVLAEALGLEACLQRVKCFATDADKAAIWQARQGIYSELEVASVPTHLRTKYFKQTEKGFIFHSQLRQRVVFAEHNLLQDAPISKLDLLLCRNVMIYFNVQTQLAVLTRFHFALKDTGFLFLGKAEALINRRQIFQPISLRHRIYAKNASLELNEMLLIKPQFRKKSAIRAIKQQPNIY